MLSGRAIVRLQTKTPSAFALGVFLFPPADDDVIAPNALPSVVGRAFRLQIKKPQQGNLLGFFRLCPHADDLLSIQLTVPEFTT